MLYPAELPGRQRYDSASCRLLGSGASTANQREYRPPISAANPRTAVMGVSGGGGEGIMLSGFARKSRQPLAVVPGNCCPAPITAQSGIARLLQARFRW